MGLQKTWIFDSPPSPPLDDGFSMHGISSGPSTFPIYRRPMRNINDGDSTLSAFGDLPQWNPASFDLSAARFGRELRQRRSKVMAPRKPYVVEQLLTPPVTPPITPPATPATPCFGANVQEKVEQVYPVMDEFRPQQSGKAVKLHRPRPKPVPNVFRPRASSNPIVINTVEDLIALVLPSSPKNIEAPKQTKPQPQSPKRPSSPPTSRCVSHPPMPSPSTPAFDIDSGSDSDDDEPMLSTPKLNETALPTDFVDAKGITAQGQFAFLSPNSPDFSSSPVNPIQRASFRGYAGAQRVSAGPVPSSGDDEMEAKLQTLRMRKKLGPKASGNLMSRYSNEPIPTWN